MKKIRVSASIEYDIIVDGGMIDRVGELSLSVTKPCIAAILTDDTVNALYGDRLERSLQSAGYRTEKYVIPHGEHSKSAENFVGFLNFLADHKLSRTDVIFALGGGVIGDLAGFCASSYLRGIKFIQIPTTLLAMVDSSVGGKTGINLDAGKNLAGSFYQPSLVLCDYDTLDTLPDDIFADGCAEVIKYGIINDRALFDKLKNPIKEQIEDIICNCVANKRDIVNLDERDLGVRQLLNLGHTAGHAIEQCSNFEISHGSAVSIGTVLITKMAANLGLCSKDDVIEVRVMFESYNLPVVCPFGAKELAKVACSDKKIHGAKINLVVPHSIGNSRLYPAKVEDLASLFALGL